uniref:Zgc:92606 n=1 Tax=Paramormyrops kingsleyae TaxID=1676925 RepID=A0A3B3QVZ9_9TELE
MGSQYKRSVPLDVRKAEGERVRAKHPDKIPIIVERAPRSRAPDLDKKKYLVPSDLTVGQLCFLIRQRVSMRPEEALFFFVNNLLPPSSSPLSVVYEVIPSPSRCSLGFSQCPLLMDDYTQLFSLCPFILGTP